MHIGTRSIRIGPTTNYWRPIFLNMFLHATNWCAMKKLSNIFRINKLPFLYLISRWRKNIQTGFLIWAAAAVALSYRQWATTIRRYYCYDIILHCALYMVFFSLRRAFQVVAHNFGYFSARTRQTLLPVFSCRINCNSSVFLFIVSRPVSQTQCIHNTQAMLTKNAPSARMLDRKFAFILNG